MLHMLAFSAEMLSARCTHLAALPGCLRSCIRHPIGNIMHSDAAPLTHTSQASCICLRSSWCVLTVASDVHLHSRLDRQMAPEAAAWPRLLQTALHPLLWYPPTWPCLRA
jgi:hypothetical protein